MLLMPCQHSSLLHGACRLHLQHAIREGASTLLLARLPQHGEEVPYHLQSAALHGFMPCQQDG